MNKMKIALWATFAIVSLSTVGGLLITSTSTVVAEGKTDVIHFTEQTIQNTFISQTAGAKVLEPGDRIIYTNDLLSDNEVVGHDSGYCEFVAVAPRVPEVLCITTLLLDNSQLVTSSLFNPADEVAQKPIAYAISGGTGKFLGARGEVIRIQFTDQAQLAIYLKESW